MDIASVVGLVLGISLLLITILISEGASFAAFFNAPSLMVVIGGAIAAVLLSFPLKSFLGLGRVLKNVFFNKPRDITELIEQLVSLAETARRDGLLALEGRLEEISDPFIVLGIQMAVDGTRAEVIEDIMRTEIDAVAARHQDGKKILEQLGRFAPAFGMIGTLMGLIIMLGQLDNPDNLGPGMAVALITTLYGAVMANILCLPCAEKLGFISKQELLSMEIIVRGIMGIQSGENPRVIEQKLTTFVPPRLRNTNRKAA
ncbi:MAG TPA: motility protein A [Planctomycetaceae bacterium]|nr:motility protein A [Planctomycetaceae bacterium]HIQ22108.1 motility protein A [Planctomycetota bacterium]